MTRYFVGTAGWSYKDWEGIVYPEKKQAPFHALTFLAQYINTVEINSTFYRPPAMHVALSWTKKVGKQPDFLFAVKLHQVFTHQRKDFTQKNVDDFKFGIEPLRAKNRLAAILVQFPWSFANTSSNLDYLKELFQLFSDYPLAVEVRHGSWDHEHFFKMLKDHRVCFCNIDQPLIGNSIKPTAIVTTPEFSYARLHGRNYKNWFKKDAGRDDRYDYLYSQDELAGWIEKIKELGSKSDKVFVITNNHYRGQALANALQIKNKITGEKLDIPFPLLKQYPLLKDIVAEMESGQFDLFSEE
ncbi:MAG: DUF72 domain-containing protein [Candidatus Aminicenantes bacterium]|jgi:uncharacterized protein YecE (DUF72 family)